MKDRASRLGRTIRGAASAIAHVALASCNNRGSVREATSDALNKPRTEWDDGGGKAMAMARPCPEGLLAARRGGSAPDRYVVPTEAERATMVELFAKLGARRPAEVPAVPLAFGGIGYRIAEVAEIPGAVLVAEIESRRRGGGAYLLRPGSPSRVVVQAPHTFFDEGTLPLACELFERASAAALFIDTAHRYKAAEVDERGNYPADVAHANDSLFQAATVGMMQADPGLTIVQLHGFAPRESGANVVLSAGTTKRGAPLVEQARLALSAAGVPLVHRFPEDTPELGATTNVQGVAVRAKGGRFLHIEIAASLRKAMLSDDELRGRFLDAIAQSVNVP